MTRHHGGRLLRLPRHYYQGRAVVHWVQTEANRATGWLSQSFHQEFRELMIHCAIQHHLVCPSYNLMPDHLHLIWMGLRQGSDQLNAMAFLRRHMKRAMAPYQLQKQAYEHVLRAHEREAGALASTCFYILNNPVRAGLVEAPNDWPYHGAIIPGYPDWDPLDEKFWDRFWAMYEHRLDPRTFEGNDTEPNEPQ